MTKFMKGREGKEEESMEVEQGEEEAIGGNSE
jgi:hypothetical protein